MTDDASPTSDETHTRLNIDERQDLLETIQGFDPGDSVRIHYDSNRSSSDKIVEGTVVPSNELLAVRTSDLKGRLEISEWNVESTFYAGIVAYATKPGTRSKTRNNLGEVLDVEAVESGDLADE